MNSASRAIHHPSWRTPGGIRGARFTCEAAVKVVGILNPKNTSPSAVSMHGLSLSVFSPCVGGAGCAMLHTMGFGRSAAPALGHTIAPGTGGAADIRLVYLCRYPATVLASTAVEQPYGRQSRSVEFSPRPAPCRGGCISPEKVVIVPNRRLLSVFIRKMG